MTNLRCMLEEAATISKHQPAIRQGERIIPYSEWNELSAAVARRLEARGVQRGDRIGVFMATDWRLLVLITGIIRAGAVAVPVSTRLPRAGVVASLQRVDCARILAYLSDKKEGGLEGIEVWSPDEFLATPEVAASPAPPMPLDAPALIVFTSGTSSEPRPAVLSYGNLYYNAQGANANLRLHSKDTWLMNLPLYHVSGLGVLFRCILGGASVVIPEQRETLLQAIARYRPTFLSLVPTHLADLLRANDVPGIDAARVLLVGGAACDQALAEQAVAKRWPLYLTYGMTETASQIATMPVDAPPAKRVTTSGKVLRHRTVKVADDGEILVRGSCVFRGYWQGGAVQPATDAEGWWHTGDLGSIDAEGYLSVRGRRDALIISGGENIQPEEIETCLRAIEGVEQAVVVGIPHKRFGQRPVAVVKATTGDDVVWRKRLSALLPSFKVPDAFYPWPEGVWAEGIKPSRARVAAWIAERTA